MGVKGVGEGLSVHVFVEGCEERKVSVLTRRALGVQLVEGVVEDAIHVGQGVFAREQGQVPSGVLGDLHGVVEFVGVLEHGRTVRETPVLVVAPEEPVLFEPGEMTYLPQRRVDDA